MGNIYARATSLLEEYHKVQKSQPPNICNKQSQWVLPPSVVCKVNVNVSISKSKENLGFGYAIRGSNGR